MCGGFPSASIRFLVLLTFDFLAAVCSVNYCLWFVEFLHSCIRSLSQPDLWIVCLPLGLHREERKHGVLLADLQPGGLLYWCAVIGSVDGRVSSVLWVRTAHYIYRFLNPDVSAHLFLSLISAFLFLLIQQTRPVAAAATSALMATLESPTSPSAQPRPATRRTAALGSVCVCFLSLACLS